MRWSDFAEAHVDLRICCSHMWLEHFSRRGSFRVGAEVIYHTVSHFYNILQCDL